MSSTHKSAECPYKEFKSHSCKKIGQLSKCCFKNKEGSGKSFPNKSKTYIVHQVVEETVASQMIGFSLNNIGLGYYNAGYKVKLAVEDIEVTLELDTGFALTLSLKTFISNTSTNII